MRKLIAPWRRDRAVRRARCRGGAGRQRRRHVTELKLRDLRLATDDGRGHEEHRRVLEQGHPAIQVEIVPVDVNSVHDKLLTSFVGGTAADIIHDEAADIAGFTQQGYLANLTPLIPKTLKKSIPKSIWDSVNFGGKITGVPVLLQTYNVFANMDDPQAGGHQGADAGRSVDAGPSSASIAKRLTNSTATASAGASARRRRHPDDVAQLRRTVLLPRERQVAASSSAPPSRTS